MAEIRLPEPRMHEVGLTAEPVLGPGGDSERLRDRLSISEPVIIEVKADRLSSDPAVRDSLLELQSAGHAEFWLVSFVCAFKDGHHHAEPFEDAELGIELSAAEPAEPPTAWSLSPVLRSAPARRSFSVKIGLKLAIILDPSLELSGETGEEAWYLRAWGERTSEPAWQFRNINGHDLTGDNEINMIVKKTAGGTAHGHVEVTARVQKRRMGIIRYTAELPNAIRDFAIGKPGRG
jgi:hypothetical protein